MQRTQAQGDCAPSHCSANGLFYAVDWNDGVGGWLVRAANGGGLRCDPWNNGQQETFGNFIGVYNSVANQMSVYAHLQSCGFWVPGVTYDATQGQGIGVAWDTGFSEGKHLHFHVVNGNDLTGYHSTVSFAMSDKSTFEGNQGTYDGPSDNSGVAYDATDMIDTTIRNTYLAEGGASGAWWNVGAPYRSTTESYDEFGGPCRNTTTALVHLCPSNYGSGIMANQNFIDWKGVRQSIYRTNVSGHVKGQTQGALSALSGGQPVARILGAPTSEESGGRQYFQGGYAERLNGAGVRIYVYTSNSGGGYTLREILHYDAYSAFCPSINDDRKVNSTDQLILARDLVDRTYSLSHDLNGDRRITSADQLLMNPRVPMTCVVTDP
jgi:hypothetical protein